MLEETLSQYIGIDPAQISRLLNMKQSKIYEDKTYKSWVDQLDTHLLEETLAYARDAYEKHLPQFIDILQKQYGMTNIPMSSYTLGNWLVGFLQFNNTISKLSQIHSRIPQAAFRDMLPQMLHMLDDMPKGREDWQCALALMSLPLIADRS